LLKVEDQVQNPKLRFEYFGLPRDFNDPEAKKAGIHSVPTGIVYVNGREAGRITGEGSSPGGAKREIPNSRSSGSRAQAASPARAAPWSRPFHLHSKPGRRERSGKGWTRTVRSPGESRSSGFGSTTTVPSRGASDECQKPRISASSRRCCTATRACRGGEGPGGIRRARPRSSSAIACPRISPSPAV